MDQNNTPAIEIQTTDLAGIVRELTSDELLAVSGGPQVVNDGAL